MLKKIKKFWRKKRKIFFNSFLVFSLFLNFGFPQFTFADNAPAAKAANPFAGHFSLTPPRHLTTKHLPLKEQKIIKPKPKPKYFYILVTAYSSTVDQCDNTPFITANGTHVFWGVVAANFLPFGTRLRFPRYFGKKVFIVEDRMHPRFSHRLDIWMPTRQQAKNFGRKWLKVEILPAK